MAMRMIPLPTRCRHNAYRAINVLALFLLPLLVVVEVAGDSVVRHNRYSLSKQRSALKGSRRRTLGSDDDKFEKEKKSSKSSRAPTVSPAPTQTFAPSTAPTMSFQPSMGTFTVTNEVADGFGNIVTQAQCDNSKMPLSQQEEDTELLNSEQLVTYEYQLTTTTATVNPVTAARWIEGTLQTQLARKLLDCVYNEQDLVRNGQLEFWTVGSQPIDRMHSNDCSSSSSTSSTFGSTTEAAATTKNCYVIRGGLTVQFFSLANGKDDDDKNKGGQRRRQQEQQSTFLQQDEITDVRVVDTLGPILRDWFESGQLLQQDDADFNDEIDNLKWTGLTNVAIPGEESNLDDEDDNTTDRGDNSAPAANDSSLTSSDDRSLKVIPALALSFTIVALIALIVLVVVKRRRFFDNQQLKSDHVDSSTNNNSPNTSREDDGSFVMQQSLRSGVHAPLKYPVARNTMSQPSFDVTSSSTKSEGMRPPRDYRMRETDTATSCGMDMELISTKLEKNDSSLWYPYEESRETSLTSGYSYSKGPDKVYVLDECPSFEESTINLGPNFATDFSVDPDDSFHRPTFVKPDLSLIQSTMEKSMEDLKPHESLSARGNSRYYGSQDTVVL